MPTTTYGVRAYRECGAWSVYVKDIDHTTQAETLAEVPYMARDLAAILLDVPVDDLTVRVDELLLEDGSDVLPALRALAAARTDAASTAAEVLRHERELARRIVATGEPPREVTNVACIPTRQVPGLLAEAASPWALSGQVVAVLAARFWRENAYLLDFWRPWEWRELARVVDGRRRRFFDRRRHGRRQLEWLSLP
jgi:hypothetical protein